MVSVTVFRRRMHPSLENAAPCPMTVLDPMSCVDGCRIASVLVTGGVLIGCALCPVSPKARPEVDRPNHTSRPFAPKDAFDPIEAYSRDAISGHKIATAKLEQIMLSHATLGVASVGSSSQLASSKPGAVQSVKWVNFNFGQANDGQHGLAKRSHGQTGTPSSPAVSGRPQIRFAFCTA